MPHPRYAVIELEFTGPSTPVPFDQTPVRVEITHASGEQRSVPGFFDGGTRYLVRFAPELEGSWTWRSASDHPELDGRTGELEVGPAEPGEHGPVRTASTFHFAHADGTPFRPVGTTVYHWLHCGPELQAETVAAVRDAGFNKLRFMVFPQAGGYVEHIPTLLPFERGTDGRPDVSRPVVEFFQHLDRAVVDLGRAGIQAEILIFTSYDNQRFGHETLTEAEDAAYLRYLVARLSAHPHVWWSLCNEYDLLDRPEERWDAAGRLLAETDPHDHLRSIHNWVRLFDHTRDWVTHASLQLGQATADFGRASLFRHVYRKPVVLDEICYEGDVPLRWGRLSAAELVHRFWIATVSGCYATHGESFVLPDGSLHIVRGGALQGEAPARLAFLQGLLDDVTGPGLDPVDDWWDEEYVAGVPGEVYLVYLGRQAPDSWRFRLPQGREGTRLSEGDRFAVDVIDTWAMTVQPLPQTFVLGEVGRNEALAPDSDPVELPAGRPVALRIRALS